MTAAEWTGPECFMCNGTGRDRTAVTEPHGPFARVVGHVENWRPCRACNGHGRDSAGGEIPADATEPTPVSGAASGKIGSKQDGSQPRCVNTSTGSLTADSTPALPGGISG